MLKCGFGIQSPKYTAKGTTDIRLNLGQKLVVIEYPAARRSRTQEWLKTWSSLGNPKLRIKRLFRSRHLDSPIESPWEVSLRAPKRFCPSLPTRRACSSNQRNSSASWTSIWMMSSVASRATSPEWKRKWAKTTPRQKKNSPNLSPLLISRRP